MTCTTILYFLLYELNHKLSFTMIYKIYKRVNGILHWIWDIKRKIQIVFTCNILTGQNGAKILILGNILFHMNVGRAA